MAEIRRQEVRVRVARWRENRGSIELQAEAMGRDVMAKATAKERQMTRVVRFLKSK